MKTRIILFVIAFVAFTFMAVRYYNRKEPISTMKNVKTELAFTSINFSRTIAETGQQKLKVPVKVGFVVHNTGKNDLYIQKVEPDCHCTVADFSKNPIRPNDSSIVVLKYDAANPGPFQSSAIVTTNSSPAATLLVFRGVVE